MIGKILVVDDEPGIRDIIKTYVEHFGYIVHTAADGVDALKQVESENYDVVLTDIQMPRMDGLTLTEEIRKIQPDTIIIMMTGYASVNTAVEAIKRNIFDYIMKPFQNMHTILQTIEQGIERKRLVLERNALVDDLRRTNNDLAFHRELLNEKVREIDSELGRRIERLTTIYEISRSISSITNLDVLLNTIMNSIIRSMKDAGGILWLVDFEANRLKKVITLGLDKTDFLPDTLQIHEGELGGTISAGRVRVFRNVDELSDPVFRKLCMLENISSLIMVPFSYEVTIMGVVSVLFRNNYHITDDDVSLLKAIADQASVSIKNAELFSGQQKMFRETIEALATAIDSRDHYTGGHSFMVTQYSIAIAERMGFDEKQLDLIQISGLLHDIGKIGISDAILNKPDRLTDEEMGVIKAHPILGMTIIDSINALKPVAKIIYHHHEHYDGKGYPEGIKRDDIPLMSRILTVADIFHALTSDRIYRKAMPLEKALSIMREEMGTTMDPEIGKIFFELVEEEKILPPLLLLNSL
ncbi:response regulator [bacterium]|nr:response regulator [bacterium]